MVELDAAVRAAVAVVAVRARDVVARVAAAVRARDAAARAGPAAVVTVDAAAAMAVVAASRVVKART